MKINHGKLLILLGFLHTTLSVLPVAFGKQFANFAHRYFFKISPGLSEFPLLGGQMNYENFAAFWFFYFGLMLFPLGMLVNYVQKEVKKIPVVFCQVYLAVVLVGVYMIPFSGMTFLMLPHAIFMLIDSKKTTQPV